MVHSSQFLSPLEVNLLGPPLDGKLILPADQQERSGIPGNGSRHVLLGLGAAALIDAVEHLAHVLDLLEER